MVSSRIVGAPVDRNRAPAGVMSPITKPKPMMMPAASVAWMITISGSMAPVDASDQRIRVRNPVSAPVRTGEWGALERGGLLRGVGTAASDMGGHLAGIGGDGLGALEGGTGRGQRQVGDLEGRRCQDESLEQPPRP